MKTRLSCRQACNSLEGNLTSILKKGEQKETEILPWKTPKELAYLYVAIEKWRCFSRVRGWPTQYYRTESGFCNGKKVDFKYRRSYMEFTYAPIKVAQPRVPPSWNWEPSSLSEAIGEQTKLLVLHFWSSSWSFIVSFSLGSSTWIWSDIQDD